MGAANGKKDGDGTKGGGDTDTKPHWSQDVTEHSDAMDLEPDVFKLDDPKAIAASLKASAEHSDRRRADPFRSAMSMLTFYINRAGHNLDAAHHARLEAAKEELRALFDRPADAPATKSAKRGDRGEEGTREVADQGCERSCKEGCQEGCHEGRAEGDEQRCEHGRREGRQGRSTGKDVEEDDASGRRLIAGPGGRLRRWLLAAPSGGRRKAGSGMQPRRRQTGSTYHVVTEILR